MENTLLRYAMCLVCFLIHVLYAYGQQVALQVSLQHLSNNDATPILSDSTEVLHQKSNTSVYWQKSQKEQARRYFWVNAGLGGTSMHHSAGSATVSLNYGLNKRLFTARYGYNAQYFTVLSSFHHVVREAGVLYGLLGKGRAGYASIGAGIGLVRDVAHYEGWFPVSDSKQTLYMGPCIPLESQLFLTTRYVGIGLILLANINLHQSYVGYLLSLQVGKLKNKRVRS